jgi:hypothetical protein
VYFVIFFPCSKFANRFSSPRSVFLRRKGSVGAPQMEIGGSIRFVAKFASVGFAGCNQTLSASVLGARRVGFVGKIEDFWKQAAEFCAMESAFLFEIRCRLPSPPVPLRDCLPQIYGDETEGFFAVARRSDVIIREICSSTLLHVLPASLRQPPNCQVRLAPRTFVEKARHYEETDAVQQETAPLI